MHTDGCSVHMPIIFVNSKSWGSLRKNLSTKGQQPHTEQESFLAPQNIELGNIMGMCTEHPSVGMFRPSQPIGICIEQYNILGMLRQCHYLSMHIEHHRTHIRH